jgi:hypothetical protein
MNRQSIAILETHFSPELAAARLASDLSRVRIEEPQDLPDNGGLTFIARSPNETLRRLYSPPDFVGAISQSDSGSVVSGYWRDPRLWFHRLGYLGAGAFTLYAVGLWTWGRITDSAMTSDQGDPLFPQMFIAPAIVLAVLATLSLYRAGVKRNILTSLIEVLEGETP